jgi:aminopeptidase N
MRKLCCPAIIAILLLAVPVFPQFAESGTDFRVVRYALEITPDIPAKSIVGRETITLHGVKEGVRTVVFSGNALVIDSATLDGHPVQASVTPKLTSLTLPDALPQGYPAVLRISYHGAPRTGMVFGPQSVYTSYSACEWMICSEDSPGDKAEFALDLHVPPGMSSLAVGKLAKRLKSPDGSEIDQWRMTLPYSAYLYDFAIGKFATIKTKRHDFQLTYVSEIATAAELQKDFEETAGMIQSLSEKAGVGLPSGRYAQLLVPGREAQEAATYSIIGKDYLDPKIDWVIVHELSHQWWGNLITCSTWKDFWLNEGITSFMVAAWREKRYGRAVYDADLDTNRKGLAALREKGMRDYPLAYGGAYPSIRERRAIQYSKGALFMDHLRRVMGEDAFWAGLRSYTRQHAGGTVTSIDFERSMEKSTARDLTAEFAEWVFGPSDADSPRQPH